LEPAKPVEVGSVSIKLELASEQSWAELHSPGQLARAERGKLGSWPQLLEKMAAGRQPSASWSCYLPASIQLPLSCRCWQRGDFLELTDGSRKKLSDIFIDAKVPSCFKSTWLLLADAGGRILWLPGLADGSMMQFQRGSERGWLVSVQTPAAPRH
jgi:tRNA(Ile)-lysidine synthetase-like protein